MSTRTLLGVAGVLIIGLIILFLVSGGWGSSLASLRSQLAALALPSSTPTETVLNSCGDISSPGIYALEKNIIDTKPVDLTRDPSERRPCLNIHDTSGITLLCNGFSIIGNGADAIQINNVRNFEIANCTVDDPGAWVVRISNSSSGVIRANVLKGMVFDVKDSSDILVADNKFTSTYQQNGIASSTIANNSFVLNLARWPSSAAALIISNRGSGTKIVGNTIDGSAKGIISEQIGADDGIIFDGEDGTLVIGNSVKNTWDCGIETSGLITNARIADNNIFNAGICGIGGWYWGSWKNNIVENNKVEATAELFYFSRVYGLRDGEEAVYFKDNTFVGNSLVNPTEPEGFVHSSWFNINWQDPGTAPKLILENNIFKNNNFGTVRPLYFGQPQMAIDGGGNVCVKEGNVSVINCTATSSSTISLGKTDKTAYMGGDTITVSWNTKKQTTSTDWIGIVRKGRSWADFGGVRREMWFYTGGAQSGTKTLVAPNVSDTYELVYFKNDGYAEAGRGSQFTVSAVPLVQSDRPSYGGGETVHVSWNNPNLVNAKDWIGLVKNGGQWGDYTGSRSAMWFYVDGQRGTKTLVAPPAAGMYQLVYFLNDGYQEFYRSNAPIVVTSTESSDDVTIVPGAPTFPNGGLPITATWNKPTGARADDWAALVPEGTSWKAATPTNWVWVTSNSQSTQGAAGATSGSISFPSGTSAGKYQIVYYLIQQDANGQYVEIGRSASFEIGPVAPIACSLKTDKPEYIFGEKITLYWSSTNATYGAFAPDTSGKDTFNIGGDTLAPNGQITFLADIVGNPYVALKVYNDAGQSASCLLTIPVSMGSSDDVTIVPGAPTFTNGGSLITATWKKTAGATAREWAALVPVGETWNGKGSFAPYWVWVGSNSQTAGLSGMTSGTVSFASSVSPGKYQIVYYNDVAVGESIYKELARTVSFEVSSPSTGATIQPSAPYFAGKITAAWNKPTGARVDDWIAVVPEGGSWQATSPVNWIWVTSSSQETQGLSGATSGSITIPAGNPAGKYQLVYYLIEQDANGKYIEIGRSPTFEIGPVASTHSRQNFAAALAALETLFQKLFQTRK